MHILFAEYLSCEIVKIPISLHKHIMWCVFEYKSDPPILFTNDYIKASSDADGV